MLKVLKPGDHIVFYNIERAFRNTLNCLRWVSLWAQHNITPHFICDGIDFTTAGVKFVGTVAAAAAQYYSDLNSERIREALSIKRMKAGLPPKRVKEKTKWIASEIKGKVREELEIPCEAIRVYNRVSTNDQELGLAGQGDGNLKYARGLMERYGAGKVSVYEDDGVSAFSVPFKDRPGASRLFHDLKRGDHLVIFRADRPFRNVQDAVTIEKELRERGVVLHLSRDGIRTDNEFGRLFFQVLSVFAEQESAIKRRRKLDMNDWLKSQGRPTNNLPRYHKAVKRGSTKKLTHNMDTILDVFTLWVLREAGFTWVEANLLMHALKGARIGKIPAYKNARKTSGDHFPMTNEHNAKGMIAQLDQILSEVPTELAVEIADQAVRSLQRPVEAKYLWLCSSRFPVADIEHRLASREIDERLGRLLPTHIPCATTPV